MKRRKNTAVRSQETEVRAADSGLRTQDSPLYLCAKCLNEAEGRPTTFARHAPQCPEREAA
jgi:hypothetical protein